jgi:hypothetical protein
MACLDKFIAHGSLRALDAKFMMDHWCDVPMEEQIRQSFHLLSSACFLYSHMLDEEEDEVMDFEEKSPTAEVKLKSPI